MARSPVLVSLLFTLPLTASLACWGPADTAKRVVVVQVPGPQPYAVNEHATLLVSDDFVGPTECHSVTEAARSGSSSCNSEPTRECIDPVRANDSTVESVTCEPGCSATVARSAAGRFAVDLVGHEIGAARVVVRLRDAEGAIREAAGAVTFAPATTLTVVRVNGVSPHGTTYAALPGATFAWCTRIEGVGARDPSLLSVVVMGATQRTVGGGPAGTARCDIFTRSAPGVIDFIASFGGLTRHETIRVFDPADVRAIELVELDGANNWSAVTPIEQDVLPNQRPLTSLRLAGCGGGWPDSGVAQRLTFADGRVGLANVVALRSQPADLIDWAANNGSPEHDAIGWLRPGSRGKGALISEVGAARVSVPATVTGTCLPITDAGDPDAGDAGDAGYPDAADAGSD
jgi:hypothetical protein